MLNLSNNQLISVDGLFALTNLEVLYLSNNQLTSVPDLSALTSLEWLDLFNNQLTSVDNLSALTNLEVLNLSNNQLTSVPDLSALTSLEWLSLFNTQLTSMARANFSLPNSCRINISGCPESFTEFVRANCNADGYNGPDFFFSMGHRENRTGEIRELDALLKELADRSEISIQFEEHEKNSLRDWLARLSGLADFRNQNKRSLAEKVIGYIETANADKDFRKVFFALLTGSTASCGDRVAYSILEVGIQCKLADLDLKNCESCEVAKLLKTVMALELLREVARAKVRSLVCVDEIEVYLAYPVKLKKKLDLDIDVEEMLYFACSSVTQGDLDRAQEYVKEAMENEERFHLFLADHDVWKEHLEVKYSDKYQSAYDRAEAGEDYTDCLAELTKEVLASS